MSGAVRRRRLARAAGLVLALALAAPAGATTIVAKSFSELCAEADLVFIGTVTRSESGWADPSKQAIATSVTFSDLTWLRGAARPSLTLRFAGGEVDGLREEIAGVPRFTVGDRVVIFAHDGAFISPIVGFSQGLFRVGDGPDGPIVLDPSGQPLSGTMAKALRQGAASTADPLPLDQFVARVHAELKQSEPGSRDDRP